MIMNKTVDKFKNEKSVACSGYHNDILFDDVVKIYQNDSDYDKIVIREWKDGKVIREVII